MSICTTCKFWTSALNSKTITCNHKDKDHPLNALVFSCEKWERDTPTKKEDKQPNETCKTCHWYQENIPSLGNCLRKSPQWLYGKSRNPEVPAERISCCEWDDRNRG